jgi:hypothetical protein
MQGYLLVIFLVVVLGLTWRILRNLGLVGEEPVVGQEPEGETS